MRLTNQNREDLKRNMRQEEYRNLIAETFPEFNIDKFNINIAELAKLVAIRCFTEDISTYHYDGDNSFEVIQAIVITKRILKTLKKDGWHGLS